MPLLANDTHGAITRKRLETYVAQREKVTAVALTDAASTPTAAQLIDSKLFVQTPTADRTFTLPTAALVIAALTDEAREHRLSSQSSTWLLPLKLL